MFSPKLILSSSIHSSCVASQSSLRNKGFKCNKPFFGSSWSSSSCGRRQPRHWALRNESQLNLSQKSCTITSASENGNQNWTGEIGEVAKAVQRKTDLQVVLVSPQIPGNTGCIARSCAAAAVGLHLVEPMGFEINSAKLKRAGLDYWPYVVVKVHKSWADFSQYFEQQEGDKRLLGFTKTGNIAHTAVKYRKGDWLLFGSETEGLPDVATEECVDEKHGGGLVRIPIDETYVRCLNLSVAAGIGIYEALRQLGCTDSMMQRPVTNSVPIEREDIFC
ncbi:unnamed protein product [Calypogeia fissa]